MQIDKKLKRMSVTLLIGPMYSRKTGTLFQYLRREEYAGKRIRVYKYAKDTRYSKRELACSHDGRTMTAIPVTSFLYEAVPQDVDVIGIDEGQFIEGLVEFCDYHASAGKRVIVAALDSNYLREPFPSVVELVSKAEHVLKLHAVCILCKQDAAFTRKLVVSENADVEDIGGADKYLSSCRACFHAPIPQDVLLEYQRRVASMTGE